jgi:hypothetical protein
MAKTSALPTPDPTPAEGGSYLLNEQTGKWELLDRTEPARPDAKPEAELPAQPEAKPEADTAPVQLPSSVVEG